MDRNLLKKAVQADVEPTPGYILDEMIKMSFHSREACQKMRDFLINTLQKKQVKHDVYVKGKTLRILRHLCDYGNPYFTLCLAEHVALLRQLSKYTCEVDPLHGDTLIKNVREEAMKCVASVFKDEKKKVEMSSTLSDSPQPQFFSYTPDCPSTELSVLNSTADHSYSMFSPDMDTKALSKNVNMSPSTLISSKNSYSPNIPGAQNSSVKKMVGFGNPYFNPSLRQQHLRSLPAYQSNYSQAPRPTIGQREQFFQHVSQAFSGIASLFPSGFKTQLCHVGDKLSSKSNFSDFSNRYQLDQESFSKATEPSIFGAAGGEEVPERFRFSGRCFNDFQQMSNQKSFYTCPVPSVELFQNIRNNWNAKRNSMTTDAMSHSTHATMEDDSSNISGITQNVTLVSLENLIEETCSISSLTPAIIQGFIDQAQKHPSGHLVGLFCLCKIFPKTNSSIEHRVSLSYCSTWKSKYRVLTLLNILLSDVSDYSISCSFQCALKDVLVTKIDALERLNIEAMAPKCRLLVEKICSSLSRYVNHKRGEESLKNEKSFMETEEKRNNTGDLLSHDPDDITGALDLLSLDPSPTGSAIECKPVKSMMTEQIISSYQSSRLTLERCRFLKAPIRLSRYKRYLLIVQSMDIDAAQMNENSERRAVLKEQKSSQQKTNLFEGLQMDLLKGSAKVLVQTESKNDLLDFSTHETPSKPAETKETRILDLVVTRSVPLLTNFDDPHENAFVNQNQNSTKTFEPISQIRENNFTDTHQATRTWNQSTTYDAGHLLVTTPHKSLATEKSSFHFVA